MKEREREGGGRERKEGREKELAFRFFLGLQGLLHPCKFNQPRVPSRATPLVGTVRSLCVSQEFPARLLLVGVCLSVATLHWPPLPIFA